MILLIDGFNLIYKFPELETLMYESKLNLAREGLLKLLNQYKTKRGNTVIHVFFDGKKDKYTTSIVDDVESSIPSGLASFGIFCSGLHPNILDASGDRMLDDFACDVRRSNDR